MTDIEQAGGWAIRISSSRFGPGSFYACTVLRRSAKMVIISDSVHRDYRIPHTALLAHGLTRERAESAAAALNETSARYRAEIVASRERADTHIAELIADLKPKP